MYPFLKNHAFLGYVTVKTCFGFVVVIMSSSEGLNDESSDSSSISIVFFSIFSLIHFDFLFGDVEAYFGQLFTGQGGVYVLLFQVIGLK